jgi:hypothetical protein
MAQSSSVNLDAAMRRYGPTAAGAAAALSASTSAAAAYAATTGAVNLKSMNEQAWSNRVGEEFSHVFQSAAQSHLRHARSREARSRAQRLGLVDPGHLAEKALLLWGAGGEERLDALARQALYRLTAGGSSSLNTSLQPRDPLERHLLLSKMAEHLGHEDSPAQRELALSVQQLHEQHGDELLALDNSAPAFAKLHPQAAAPEAATDDAAAGLRRVYLEAGRTVGDAVVSPNKLARGLLERFDADRFEPALRQLGEGVLADLRSSQPSRHAERVAVALANAGAFMNVRRALGISRELRLRLKASSQDVGASDAQLASKLLEASDEGCASAHAFAAGLLGAQAGEQCLGRSALLSCLRHAVTCMPAAWWPEAGLPARLQLLEDLDARLRRLSDSGATPASGIESRLRSAAAGQPLAPQGA